MNDNSAIDAIFKLGEIEHDAPWINYLALGINKHHIPALLKLLDDPALLNAAVDSNEIWVPQHTWRALGQLAEQSTIPALIKSFNALVHDNDAHQELPDVMAMIGPAAQQALGDFLLDTSNEEFARAIAAQALQNIAQRYPTSRALSIKLLTAHCTQQSRETPDLNGLIVCDLLDLDAKESINEIRELYQLEIVDLYAVGDIEDVEIALGLRGERDTPRPDYGKVHSLKQQTNIATTNKTASSLYDELNEFLTEYCVPTSLSSLSQLDGFFAAINCSPSTILPSRWIPAIWGGEEYSPAFPDIKTTHLFTSAVMAFYNQITRTLASYTYNALFIQKEISGTETLIVNEWCNGFIRGLALWQPLSGNDQIILHDLLTPIQLFASEQQRNKLDEMSDAARETQKNLIEENTRQLFDHFVTQRAPGDTIIHDEPKIGRNDPCPCGSGKKFKKCCLH